MNLELVYLILEIVSEIPVGKVASYKQIATLAGWENRARYVGKVLSHVDLYGTYPCHRVVNCNGRLVPGWKEQKELLLKEGVTFLKNGCVDMKRFQWKI